MLKSKFNPEAYATDDEFSQAVYEFALSTRQTLNYSWDAIRDILVEKGLSEEDATNVVENLIDAEDEDTSKQGTKEILVGLLLIAIGVVATMCSDRYIFYGAVVCGVIGLIRGIYHKC